MNRAKSNINLFNMKTYLIKTEVERLRGELEKLKKEMNGYDPKASWAIIETCKDEIKQYKAMIAAISGSFVLAEIFGFLKKRKKRRTK